MTHEEPSPAPDLKDIVAVFAKHMAWRRKALCLRADKRRVWFTCGEDASITFADREVSGRQAQILATQKYCIECDVQWDCALWAINNEEPQGVWGMTVRDLLWMQRLGWGDLLVESAKEEGIPVQVAVRQARKCVARIEERSGVISPE